MSYNRWICSPPSTGIDPARSTSHTENVVSWGFDNTDFDLATVIHLEPLNFIGSTTD